MFHVSISKRCHLFQDISREIWNDIIDSHSVKVEVSEIGITKKIVTIIRKSWMASRNIGVWANQGYKENIHGSDIDIFLETTPGKFIWFALQAKALQINLRYNDFTKQRGGEFQWEKLERLSKKSGCIVRYVLYNGIKKYNFNGSDACSRDFEESQFGCSLVKTEEVSRIASVKIPTFDDFHPSKAEPWRIITCCYWDTSQYSIFDTSQVRDSVAYYPESFGNTQILDEPDIAARENNYETNAIRNFSENIGRNPFYRMIIRTTQSLSY